MQEFLVTGPLSVEKTLGLLPKVVTALDELYRRSLGPVDGLPYYYKDEALVVHAGGELVGFLNFRYTEGEGTLSVLLGWVDVAYRRRGVYARLWSKLIEVAQKRGAVRIWGSTHVDNAEMQAFYKGVGREISFISSYFPVPPKDGPPAPPAPPKNITSRRGA